MRRPASRSAAQAHPAVARRDAARPARRERRLRKTVARLRACLDGLPGLERRVLVLRSGLGVRHPRSRERVGRALELSARRVARLERRGLRRLRGLAGGGRCGGAAAPAASAPADVAAGPFAMLTAFTAAAAGAPARRSPDRIEVKGERESSGVEPELAPQGPPPAAVVRRPGDRGTDLTLPLIAFAALVGIALAVRNALRTLRD